MNREIRTDLAIELRESAGGNTEMEGVRVKTVVNEDKSIRTTTIDVINEAGEKNLKKAKGRYITIESRHLKEPDETINEQLKDELGERLRLLTEGCDNILVVGLGNRQVTPDSIDRKSVV